MYITFHYINGSNLIILQKYLGSAIKPFLEIAAQNGRWFLKAFKLWTIISGRRCKSLLLYGISNLLIEILETHQQRRRSNPRRTYAHLSFLKTNMVWLLTISWNWVPDGHWRWIIRWSEKKNGSITNGDLPECLLCLPPTNRNVTRSNILLYVKNNPSFFELYQRNDFLDFDPSAATNEYRLKILSFFGELIGTGYVSTKRTRLCLKPQSRVLQPCHDRWIGSRQPVEAMNIGRSFLDGIHPMWGTVKFIPELLSPHSIQCDIRGNARVGLHYLHSWW